MAKKPRSHKHSLKQRSPKPKAENIFSRSRALRTQLIAGVIAFALLAGGSLAQWRAMTSPSVPDKAVASTSSLPELPARPANAVTDELPPEPPMIEPPMVYPTTAGYNAHTSGGLPPGALPPGVSLPGLTLTQGYGVDDGIRQKFTGKERDNETGLDYFGARYYSSAQGRFTSPDELRSSSREFAVLGRGHPTAQALPFAELTNPQTLNKYAYALNNPLRYVDQDGHKPQDSAEIRMQQAIRDVNSGRITEKQYWERLRGAGYGAAAGVAAILAVKAGVPALTAAALWATRNPQAVQQVAQELVQASSGNPASANLGTPLTSIFNVEKNALTSGNLLFGSLKNAEVAAQFSRNGNTLVAGIVGVFNKTEGMSGSSIKSLLNSVKDFARQEGLESVEVQAIAVINPDLQKRLLQQGFQRTTVVVDGEKVDALTKTIRVR